MNPNQSNSPGTGIPRRFPNARFVACAMAAALAVSAECRADTYSVSGTNILKNNSFWVGGGVDALDQFGTGTKTGYNIQVVREVVDDFTECPIYSSDGGRSTSIGYLHPLQDVVNNNRSQGMITILAIFGWDTGSYTQILGDSPSSMPWYSSYKSRLAALASAFAGQSDVWIDPWNEPYSWNNSGFSESQWVSDMNDIYSTIRNAGNGNIILIPGQAEDGQEQVLLDQSSFLSGKSNVVATIHCYNGWTGNSQSNSEGRIQAIRAAGWALLFGEVGQDQWVQNCTNLLNAAVSQRVPSLGWSWNAGDGSALVSNGSPTAWGNQFFPYLPQLSPGLANGAVYELQPKCAYGSCCDVSGQGTSNGTQTLLWSYNSQSNQKWRAYSLGNGLYGFEPVNAGGKRMDVSNAGNANGTQVQIWDNNGTNAQQWRAYDGGNGTWSFEPQCAPGSRLDVNGASNANGTKIQIWSSNGSGAQLWQAIPR